MNTKKRSVRDFCLIGTFTAIISVLAQISIPMPYGVPMTLQTLAIPLAGIVLGTRNGTLAALVYILLGAIGVPVFSEFSGGLGIVLGPRSGFILSFPLMALTAGIGAGKNSRIWLVAGLVAGAAINFLCGMFLFSLIMPSDLHYAFVACVLPFLPTAVLKIAFAAISGEKIRTALRKGRVLA